jgi:glutathione S-transferase
MTTMQFRPVLYVKDRCPWSLKVRIFLLEAGLSDHFDWRFFAPGDVHEAGIRAELEPYLEKVTFPTVEIAPGRFIQDSQAIIEHYAAEFGVDLAGLLTLDQYVRGPLARIAELQGEVAALKKG